MNKELEEEDVQFLSCVDKIPSLQKQHEQFKQQRIKTIIGCMDPQERKRNARDVSCLIFEYMDSRVLTHLYPDYIRSGVDLGFEMRNMGYLTTTDEMDSKEDWMYPWGPSHASYQYEKYLNKTWILMGLQFESGFVALSIFVQPRQHSSFKRYPCIETWHEIKSELLLHVEHLQAPMRFSLGYSSILPAPSIQSICAIQFLVPFLKKQS